MSTLPPVSTTLIGWYQAAISRQHKRNPKGSWESGVRMELRKDAQRTRNAGTQMKADAKTSKALGMKYPTTPEESGQKKKKTSPVPVRDTLPC